ncbi:MAG TPA: Wzz/FepE/Etk N-terminal domain-containing protein [Rhizorhapis sp.]|nr:Wzz/FepE/Etk N-terminal domain-containing protein [Rhizorhapis sp.]
MSIQQFFAILWARRAYIFVTLAGSLIGASLVAFLLPPRYEATSRVMLNFIKPDPVTGEVISSSFARTYTQTQSELIRDYRVAGQVVDRLGMAGDPALQAQFSSLPPEQQADFRRWLADSIIARTRADLVPGTNILEISYRSTNAEIARIVADALRDAYVDISRAIRREEALRNANWFDRQATEIRAKLTETEQAKAAFEKAHDIVLQEDNSDIDSVRLAALAASSAPVMPAMPAAVPVASGAASQLAQIDAAIAQSAERLGPSHPQMQALKEQRRIIAASAAREMAAANSASAAALQAAGTGALTISREVAVQRAKVIAQRDKLGALRKLKDEVDLRRAQLAKINERIGALRQESEADQTGLTVLGNAVAPAAPFFPNRPLILIGAAVLGLAIGGLAGLLLELLGRRVRSVGDVVNGFDVPLLAVIESPEDRRPRGVLAQVQALFWPRHA